MTSSPCRGKPTLWGLGLLLAPLSPADGLQRGCDRHSIAADQAVFYCLQGDGGPSIVMAAGTGQTSQSFASLAQQLSRHTTTVTFDRAGMGRSDPGPAPRSPSAIAAELLQLLKGLGIREPWILVGHSSGGWHVMRLAALAPDVVGAVVLLDTPPVGFEARRTELLSPDERVARGEAVVTANRRAAPIVRQEREDSPRDVARGFADFPRHVPLVVLTANGQEFGAGLKNDAHRALWVEMSREWARLSDRSTFQVVEGSGHMIHLEEPVLVRRALEEIMGIHP